MQLSEKQERNWSVGLFALGLGIGLLMVWNSQIGGDQSLMLDLGWSLYHDGVWLPYGMPTSAGGRSPGGLTGLLVGLPLYVWSDYRAPALFTLILHAAAFLLLWRLLKPALSGAGRLLLLLLVWLAPWHLYFAAHIWNANYMFVFAVLHLASTQRMARYREAWSTCLHVLLIALAMQAHTSAFVLAILSLLLFLNMQIKVHWGGFVIGALLGIASFVPWVLAIQHDPTLAPGEKGFFLRGLIYVFPLVRGVLYSLEMPTLSVASRMIDFDFTPALGASINAWLGPVAKAMGIAMHVSLLASLWASWRFFKKARHLLHWRTITPDRPRAWLRRYIALASVAALISFAISPTTTMFWQAFVILPAIALILVMAGEALLRSGWRQHTTLTIKVWGMATVMLLLCQAIGAPLYRCGGRELGPMNAMLEALHVDGQCIQPH
ncbi:MAG: hypothetical protein AB7T07_07770 [Steroidobacteraceae bacterium]